MKNNRMYEGQKLRIAFGIAALALILLVNSAGASPYAYITNSGSGTVSVIDTAINAVTATVNVGDFPYGVAVNPAGTKVYVANIASNTVSVIDTATNTVTASVNVGTFPFAFGQFIGPAAVTPEIAFISITPYEAKLHTGEQLQFTATAYDDNSTKIDNVPMSFMIEDNTSDVGNVTASGLFTAMNTGTVKVTAFNGDASDEAVVTVTQLGDENIFDKIFNHGHKQDKHHHRNI
jgi:YVTN family beta-propeller protein